MPNHHLPPGTRTLQAQAIAAGADQEGDGPAASITVELLSDSNEEGKTCVEVTTEGEARALISSQVSQSGSQPVSQSVGYATDRSAIVTKKNA